MKSIINKVFLTALVMVAVIMTNSLAAISTPTITMNKESGSTVAGGTNLFMTVQDNQYKITKVTYSWDYNQEVELNTNANKCNITVAAIPTESGKHTLRVHAKNSTGLVLHETFYYYVEKEETSDGTSPTITMGTASGSTVEAGTKLTMVVQDNETKVKKVTYSWDDGTNKVVTLSANKNNITLAAIPNGVGKHKLIVTAQNAEELTTRKVFYYYVEEEEELDTTLPTITMGTASGSTVEAGTKLTMVVQDKETNIVRIAYSWDNESDTVLTTSANKCNVILAAIPNGAGKHTLRVEAKNAIGLKKTGTFYYYVEEEEELDTTLPTITMGKTSGSTVEAGTKLTMVVQDNETDVVRIAYSWDNESDTVLTTSANKCNVTLAAIPDGAGKHTLRVEAKNAIGLKKTGTFYYYVEEEEELDATLPTIVANIQSGKTVVSGQMVKITIEDKESVLVTVVSDVTNGNANTFKPNTNKYIVNFGPLNTAGTHKIKVTAVNAENLKTTKTFTYYVEDEEEENNDIPTVDADPNKGTVEYGDRITITAEDDDGIEYVEFYWDDEDDGIIKKYDDEFTVRVPSNEGKHYLYVRAMDEVGNVCKYERFTYTIEKNDYPGNPDIIGELNKNVRELRVEIRNGDDKIKFEPEEEILYYVDYYNGSSSSVKNAKIVVDLPEYLEGIEASDDGKITSSKITWNLGTLDKGDYGRLSFTAEYTSEKYNEKIITVPAKIYSGSSERDESTVRNLIYFDDGKGNGSHAAYCIGYPEGTFRPNNNITRAELATMISNIEGISSYYRGGFIDVDGHWAANNIQACVERGYMIPVGYNMFGAEENATRADLAYAIASILGVEDVEPIFIYSSDLKYSNARCAMEQLLRLGIMDGYSNGTSRPDNNIIRAEAVTIINNYLFRGELNTNGYRYSYNYENNYNYGGDYYILRFTDLPQSHWAYGHIMEATNDHRYVRVLDGNEEML